MAVHLDWRRWLTALCVLLVATLYLEPAHATDHAVPPHAAEVVLAKADGVIVHVHHTDAVHGDHDRAPDQDGADPHAHHCVGSHNACFSNDAGFATTEQVALDVAVRRSNAARASHLTFGLERPPRSLA